MLNVKCFNVDNNGHYTTIRDILKEIPLKNKQVKKGSKNDIEKTLKG